MSDFHMRLPASSANLGPAFDAAAIALALWLEVDARLAVGPGARTSISATGRHTDVCSDVERSLMMGTYRAVLAKHDVAEPPALTVAVHNQIPLGMGLGSSAAARLAGIALASHFGGLQLSSEQVLAQAIALEGHPDNVSACWLGGFVVAAGAGAGEIARFVPPKQWRAAVVMPEQPLETGMARAALPEVYPRADAVANVQATALLVAAFAQQRPDLLRAATRDLMHQPYRESLCALLPALEPLVDLEGVAGVVLSGAGPGVLLILDRADEEMLRVRISDAVFPLSAEVLLCDFTVEGANTALDRAGTVQRLLV